MISGVPRNNACNYLNRTPGVVSGFLKKVDRIPEMVTRAPDFSHVTS